MREISKTKPFRSGSGTTININLPSLRAADRNGLYFIGQASGVTMLLDGKTEFSITGNTYSTDAYRSVLDGSELFAGSAVIAPGHTPPSSVEIKIFH